MTMLTAELADHDDREGFWRHARSALATGLAPDQITFALRGADADLFPCAPPASAAGGDFASLPVDARLASLINDVVLHSDHDRFAFAYRLLWRAQRERHLAAIASDRDVARARVMAKALHRDKHKMKAFVRFREIAGGDGGAEFVAWFEPAHHIVRDIAPFFVGRFAGMRWSILTPHRSARWDGEVLKFGKGAQKSDAPAIDPLEDVWRTYYASTFNPARVKVKAMTGQMPKKYWHNLPEARLIAPLIRTAGTRALDMIEAAPTLPLRDGAAAGCANISNSDTSLQSCRRCALWQHATQPVAGEGPADARLMIVGEQPGDLEDIAGKPFFGPAGRLLSTALERTGIDRSACYLTNAVKHFKFEPRGKRRLHKSPSRHEIDHCRWWLDQERAMVRPQVILALGVSAIRGLTGKADTLSSLRSQPIRLDDGTRMIATVHPAYLLRLTDEGQKRREWMRFIEDLKLAQDAT